MKLLGGCRLHKGKIIGWAKLLESEESVLLELITSNQEVIWKGHANIYREDLKLKGIGNGNHGFVCQVPAHLLDSEIEIYVRDSESGQELPNSPVKLDDEFFRYRNRLLEMLAPPVWGVISHVFNNEKMTIIGYLVAPEGELDDYGIYVNGKRIAEMSLQSKNMPQLKNLKETFWFSSYNEQIGFEVSIDMNQAVKANPLDNTPSISIGAGKDEHEATDPLRQVLIPIFEESQLALPDGERRKRVQRNISNVQFVTLGYTHYHYYRYLYENYSGRRWVDIEKMLDWGCGCGRVSQFFLRSHEAGKVVGVDIDKDNVSWCKLNLAGGQFESSELYPPLQFGDKTFDFIAATSVFTHLDRDTMMQWLAELSRVLKPGGIAALTVNTDCTPAWRSFDDTMLNLIQNEGIYDTIVSPDLGKHLSEKDYYRNVFMSKSFIEKNWGHYFNILDIPEHVFGYQDVVICQRK